jgi:RpiB/LacA/LacB family sugar-phosphate isomerase
MADKIVIASDHAGFELKENIKALLQKLQYEVLDIGTNSEFSVDYPDFAFAAAQKVASGEVKYGILICGTGVGMSIAANKVKGVRAALGVDTIETALARAHNDANILTLGARFTTPLVAQELVKVFLATPFEGGRHEQRVKKLNNYEG